MALIDIGFSGLRVTELYYNDPDNPYMVTKSVSPSGAVSEQTYTDDGNLKTAEDPQGNVTTYTYAQEIDDPLNPKHRNLVRKIERPSVEVAGATVTYPPTELEYDEDGNLVKVIDALDQETVMTYAADGLLTSVTDRNGNTTELLYEGVAFDGSRRRLLEVKTPKGASTADGFRTVTFDYTDTDNLDNVTSITDALGNTVLREYDANDRVTKLTDPLTRVSSYAYVDGLLDEVTLPANNGSSSDRKVTMLHDSRGRVAEVHQDVSSSAQQLRVKYGFDVLGQLKALTRLQNGVEKSFLFEQDQFGRQTSMKDPLAAESTTLWSNDCGGFTQTTARGIRRKLSKDTRCQTTEFKAGTPYDDDEFAIVRDDQDFSYDELGRLVKSSRAQSSRYGLAILGVDKYGESPAELLYEYDPLDRLVTLRFREDGDLLGANDKVMLYEHDPEGNVTKMTDPEGKVTRYTYFRDNRLHEVNIERESIEVGKFVHSYDAAGRLEEIVYPVDSQVKAIFKAPGVSPPAGSGWDAKGNLLHLRYEKNGTLLRRFEYSYDPAGNRVSQLDETLSEAVKWEYGMDWLDRLVSVKRAQAINVALLPASPLGSAYLQREYAFDESDNRLFFDDHVNGLTYHYLYKSVLDEENETHYSDELEEILVSPTVGDRTLANFSSLEAFTHDADGNMTSRTKAGETITYAWDDLDKLVRVSSAAGGAPTTTVKESNKYDVNGIRKRKVDKNGNSSTEYTVGITTSVDKAGTGSAKPTLSYIMGHQLMGYEEGSGNFKYFLPDALGTVREIVDDFGDVIRSYEFQEHGLLLTSSGTGTSSPKTYQGALSVNDDRNDSGLYLMGHRHFASELGRFISRDPIGFAGGLNLYNGAGNSPVTMVDPSGLDLTVVFQKDNARGWASKVFTPETLYQADDFLRTHENRILGIVTDGHGSDTLCGADWNKNHFVGIRHKDGDVGIEFEVGNKKFFKPISDLKFPNLKFVTARSCDSAGGHPDHASEKGNKFYKWLNGYDPYGSPPYDPDSNTTPPIARVLSSLWPTAIVTGNMGPQWQYHNGASTPQRYQNGQPLP